MDKFLYDVFVYNYASGRTSIKFEKIKNLLRKENQISQLSPFYELLRMGLIDKIEGNSYGLTASKIFTINNGKYSLGVNLPNSFFKENIEKVYSQYLGLTIFKDKNWIGSPYNVEFILNHYTLQFQSLKKLMKFWNSTDVEYVKSYINLHKLDPIKNDWIEVKVYDDNFALYKRFIHNEYYFEYVFVCADKYYNIKPNETEKVLFIRLVLTKQSLFTFNLKNQILVVKNGTLLPNFIYKTLFITHILNIGKLPDDNQFQLNRDQVNQILKPLKLSYTIR